MLPRSAARSSWPGLLGFPPAVFLLLQTGAGSEAPAPGLKLREETGDTVGSSPWLLDDSGWAQ